MSLFLEKNLVATGRCSGLASAQIAHLHTRQLSRSQRQPDSRPLRACAARSVASHKLVVHASGNGASTSSRARRATEEDKEKLIQDHDLFIFDCDGVIWRGDSLIDGVPETLDLLKSLGKKLVFVTNNATKSRQGYTKKFSSLGLTVSAEEIFSSSFAAAAYLDSVNFPKDKKVYVIGDVGIQEELDLLGYQHFGGPADGGKVIELKPGFALPHDEDVGAVIVGFDRNINYYKIQYATLCISENPGCLFIATNLDAKTHLTDAQEWAGNGAMVGAIKGSTKKEPVVVGKPSQFVLEAISSQAGVDKSRICMVGDRLDTDILFGQQGGLSTMLVLSGVTTEAALLSPDNHVHPDIYTDQLPDLLWYA